MKTTLRITATLLLVTALANCATDTVDDDDNSPSESVTTDTTDDASDETED